MFNKDLSKKINRDIRFQLIDNFDFLYKRMSRLLLLLNNHKSSKNQEHHAHAITYKDTNVYSELDYQRQQIRELVLGYNGEGSNEVIDSRVSLDGQRWPLLSERIKKDVENLYAKIEEEKNNIQENYSYYENIENIGAIGDEKHDNTLLFSTMENDQVYFVPKGNFKTTIIPDGEFFGFGNIIFLNEIIKLDSKTPQKINVDYNTSNKERYYNYILGQESGGKLRRTSYANTAVGYAVLRNNKDGTRLTGFGKGALSNIDKGYSNDAFGSDALGQGKYGKRNTAIGANALKWGGVDDAIATLHDFWLKKGKANFINSYFLPKWTNVWGKLGDEYTPNKNLYSNNDDDFINNVGVGRNALVHLMKGIGNVAVGYNSQAHTIKGSENTSMGNRALRDNLLGVRNTAIGSYASVNNISGVDNVSLGGNTLQQSLHASNNTALGYGAMHFFKDDKNKNTDDTYIHGYRNTAVGTQVMQDGKNASYSTFVGSYAGRYVEGNYNVGLGASSMYNLTTGEQNVGVGGNTNREVVTGSDNVAIGYTSGPNADYNNTVSLGANAHANGDNQIQLGSADATVYAHKEIQQRSDRRDKNSIRDTEFGLDFIQKLKPVDYKYNNSNSDRFHHGFIAQDLENMKDEGYHFGGVDNPKYNGGEDVYSVGYNEIIAPLVKSVQELSEENKSLRDRLERLEGVK